MAQVALGLTVYLEDPLVWARGAAADVLGAFLAVAPVERLQWWTTSTLEEWHRVSPQGHAQLQQNLCIPMLDRPRHQLLFQLVDHVSAPEVGFLYREVDSGRLGRTGVLELTLPPEEDPSKLAALAAHVVERWPFVCAIGGHALRWHPHDKSTAFWWGYRFSRRFRGLDLQDSEQMAWWVDTGLPGTCWLTAIGSSLASTTGMDLDALCATPYAHGATTRRTPRGLLVRAGDLPCIGDVNRFDDLGAYTEVALSLAPWLMPEPPRYYGGFWDDPSATKRWVRRLVEPEGWE